MRSGFCLQLCRTTLVLGTISFIGAAEISKTKSPANNAREGTGWNIGNNWIAASWATSGGTVHNLRLTNHIDGATISIPVPFSILFKDGRIFDASSLKAAGTPIVRGLAPSPEASRVADQTSGKRFDLPLANDDGTLHVVWSIIQLDGATYLRQQLSITANDKDLSISQVKLVDFSVMGARIIGSVKGSPIVAGNFFAGFEHPISESKVTGSRATAWIERDLPLRAGQSITYSAVFGVARPGQLRRDFLAYIERERAHPYRTFLHYNSWYDLGYFTPYDQASAVDRINMFGHEMTEKRGVKLSSFLFDDGWDDHRSLWKFNSGFPEGFTPVRQAAEHYGAGPGIWMSPWGGYSKPRQERMEFARTQGYEVIDNGYALSGPKYYAAFRDVALEMVTKYGVNQFKFDGTGNVNSVFPGSQFDSDFSAAIHLIEELRAAKPDLFINLTTGTWPSPFWLRYADSIWRGGYDDAFAGVGSYRERWITYRDADTYGRIVQNGPLYPLNSLMLHGMIYAKFHKHLNEDPGNDFRNEIRSYFGTGTQLQEMYITPSLMTSGNWDDLAEAAKWSQANAEILKDTHWVGGNPAWLEVYGWASWTQAKSILTLRNPSDKPQAIRLKLSETFELPRNAAFLYAAKSPWKDDTGKNPLRINAREQHEFHLAPFQVLTLEFTPESSQRKK